MTENFADIINEEQLIQKHKKERKELQGKLLKNFDNSYYICCGIRSKNCVKFINLTSKQ